MPTRVVVLGAGFGGLELCTRLAGELGDDVQITLIDKSDSFVFGFSKLDVMFGRQVLEDARLYYRDLAAPGVDFRRETVRSIDPVTRTVATDDNRYTADILVVALGADLDLAATPGLAEGGHEFYTPAGAERLRDVLDEFESGHIVVGVLGPFFKCPPAPNEAALMLHDYLCARGIRDQVTIHLVTSMPAPIPISHETSDAIVAMLVERGIDHRPASKVTRLDPAARTLHLADGGTVRCDLLLGIPVHCAPAVAVESGLTDDGWIAVDPATFATRFPDVYAIGDVTSAPVPRAGSIAEGEAATLADVLVARLRGGAPPPPYQGNAICYIEAGGDRVARVDVNFLSGAAPTAAFHPPSERYAAEKRSFAATRRARWFGKE